MNLPKHNRARQRYEGTEGTVLYAVEYRRVPRQAFRGIGHDQLTVAVVCHTAPAAHTP
jgi:hypothetical protein